MKKLALFCVLVALSSCGVNKPSEEAVTVVEKTVEVTSNEEMDEWEEEVTPPQRPVYRGSERILTDLIHTRLEVNFIWEKSQMNGIATLTAKPHFYATDSLILDAKSMTIHSVKMDGEDLNYTHENDFLKIHLGKTYSRNDQYTVVIDYLARPEDHQKGGSAAITSEKGLYFINPSGEEPNKMPQIWTQGETESSSVWFPTIDSPNAKTTQEIFITVDDKYTTLSNGKLISSKKIADGKRVDHWKQTLPHAPYLFMMGVGEFKVVKDTYVRPNGSKMDVHYYVEPEWEPYARDIFGETPRMIKFFSELTGVEYPWDKYHQIVVRDYVSGAMENTGAVIFGDFVYKNDRELLDENDQSIIAHELFHHWFGDLVTCESWSNLPLNESFANYSQYLWDEYRYGIDEADYYAEIETDGYYESAQFQGHHDLIWFDYDDKEQMFDGHSYNKGGRILHMLRNYLGDDAFFEGLRNYLEANKFKPAEFHQLRLAFEEVSGEDLNWFFNQWFLGSGYPTVQFDHSVVGSEVIVNIEQKQNLELSPLYKIPMEVAVFDSDGKHVHKIVIDELTEEFRFPVSGALKGVIFDNQQQMLGKLRESKSKEEYIYQYYHGERFMARKKGLLKGGKSETSEGQQLILDAMADTFWGIREEAVGMANRLKEEYRTEGIKKLRDLARNDPKASVRVAAVSKLDKLVDDWNDLEQEFEQIMKTDSSYSVISVALAEMGKENPERAMVLAEGFEEERSSKMISGIAQLYKDHAGADKYNFFENAFDGNVLQGFDKLGAMSAFTMFMSRQDPEVLEKSLSIFNEFAENGSFYMQMFLPQSLNYLLGRIEESKQNVQAEILKHEENGDALYADQARKKLAAFEAVAAKFMKLMDEVNAKAGDRQLVISGGDEDNE